MNPLNYSTLEASKILFDTGIVLETEMYWGLKTLLPDPAIHSNGGYSWELTQYPKRFEESIPAPSMAEVWREFIGCGHRVLIEHTLSADRQTMLTYAWIPGAYGNSLKGFRGANPTDCLINLLAWVRKEAKP